MERYDSGSGSRTYRYSKFAEACQGKKIYNFKVEFWVGFPEPGFLGGAGAVFFILVSTLTPTEKYVSFTGTYVYFNFDCILILLSRSRSRSMTTRTRGG